MGVSPSDIVTLSAWILAPAGVSMQIQYEYAYSTTAVGIVSSQIVTATGTWQRVSFVAQTVPANATAVSLGFKAGATWAGTFYVDDVLYEKTPTLNDYFDGSTSPTQGYLPAWEGTANASPSYLYDGDLTQSWTGTANASASVLTANKCAGVTTALGYRSAHWATVGTRSLYVPAGGTATVALAAASTVIVTARNSGQTVTVTGDSATSTATDELLTVYGTTTVTFGPGWWDFLTVSRILFEETLTDEPSGVWGLDSVGVVVGVDLPLTVADGAMRLDVAVIS